MRKLFALLLVVALLVSALPALAQGGEKTEITLMGWSSSQAENDALLAMVDAFMEANPDIAVDVQLVPEYETTIQAAFASGEPPEVFYVDSYKLPDWAAAGVLAPAGDNYEDVEGLYPSLVEAFTYEDTFYCPAKDFSVLALQYNKDLFDAAGLEYPNEDWTWEDLRAAAEALTDPDAGVLGLVTPPELPRWLPFLYQAGGAVLTDDWSESAFDSEETREALEFYIGMVQDGIAGPPSAVDAGWGGEAFGQGRVAMAMEGNWVIQYLLDQFPDLNWGVAELPAHPSGNRATMVFTVCYGVAAENENPEASWKLVNFLTGEEGARMIAESGFGVMPTRSSVADLWLETRGEEIGRAFVAGAEYAYKWQFPVGFGDAIDTFNAGLQLAFQGDYTAEDIILETDEVIQDVLSR
ncbi:MAG: ABC transporter substrate-binding protein [Anaerolineae bacterium]